MAAYRLDHAAHFLSGTSARRGSLLAQVVGIVVHDHWHPYYTMTTRRAARALQRAHHLRELKALVEIEKEDWARRMQRLLRRACHAVNLARAQDLPLRPEMIALIERRCYEYRRRGRAGLSHGATTALTKAGGHAAHRHAGSATICCCGSARAKRTCSAS